MTASADARFDTALRAARDGHGRGFTTLYEMHEPRMASFVRSRGVSDPDEVVNDVFLAAFSRVREFTGGPADFRAWIFRIARNKVADWYRARERDQRRVEAAGATRVDKSAADVADGVAGTVLADELLALLTEDQREVLLLRVVAGLSGPETARVTDRPLTAVKALQRRALETLRREIRAQAVSN
jgi:RNA polymerase sigma-70 factor (ECF subfamily)